MTQKHVHRITSSLPRYWIMLAAITILALLVVLLPPGLERHTNGAITLQVAVMGDTPDSVTLFQDDTQLVTLNPPYRFTWDTLPLPEGRYRIRARARLDGVAYDSESLMVVVDRSGPTVADRIPALGNGNVWTHDPIAVTFSEPLDAASVGDDAVILTAGGGAELAKTLWLSEDGRTLTIAPLESPNVPTTLTVRFADALPNVLTDVAGNPLQLPTDPWSWQLPAWQQPGDQAALDVVPVAPGEQVGGMDIPIHKVTTDVTSPAARALQQVWAAPTPRAAAAGSTPESDAMDERNDATRRRRP